MQPLWSKVREREPIALPELKVRRAIRELRGLRQADLGEVIGVSAVAICRYETGEREPRGETRRRYAAALEELRRG
jgi:transcriptional regulator with XRE-family HTH domain